MLTQNWTTPLTICPCPLHYSKKTLPISLPLYKRNIPRKAEAGRSEATSIRRRSRKGVLGLFGFFTLWPRASIRRSCTIRKAEGLTFYGWLHEDGSVPFRCRDLLSCGEEVELPRLRLRDLDLSSFPAGVKSLPLQYTLCFFMVALNSHRNCLFVWNPTPLHIQQKGVTGGERI